MTEEFIDEAKKHHPFCNRFMCEREGCPQCERLFESLPVKESETPVEFTNRVLKEIFSDAEVFK